MEQAAEILVIINSAVLAVFLILAIAGIIQLLILVKRVRRFVEAAENVAEVVSSVSESIRQAATTVTFGNIIHNVAQSFTKAKKGK